MKRFFVLLLPVLFFSTVLFSEETAPKVSVSVNRENHLFHCGEEAVFTVTVQNPDGTPFVSGILELFFRKNGLPYGANQRLPLSQGTPIVTRNTLTEPGFLTLSIRLHKDGKTIYFDDAAAGYEPEKIRAARNAPTDLLQYWHGEFDKLNKTVPPEFKIAPAPEFWRNYIKTHNVYDLDADHLGGTKIYASLTVPKKAGTYPLIISVPPAGNCGRGYFVNENAITLSISVFDRFFKSNQEYAEFNKPTWYFCMGATTRENYYYYKSILGVMRMMEYGMSLPEWDGKKILTVGRSQGGGFALIMAALNPKVTAVACDVPALCDHNAREVGREGGWPQIVTRSQAFKEAAPYFDAANFASHLSCPALFSVGFIDSMCTPSSVYAAYNNLKGEKRIVNMTATGHGWGDKAGEALYQQELEKFLKEQTEKR